MVALAAADVVRAVSAALVEGKVTWRDDRDGGSGGGNGGVDSGSGGEDGWKVILMAVIEVNEV